MIERKKGQQDLGALFAKKLAQELTKRKIFAHILVDSSANEPETRLVLTGYIGIMRKKGWAKRAMLGSESEVSISGRLSDIESDKTVLTFTRSRKGSGGVIGAGGWLSAGEGTMVDKLVEWIADDVAKALEKEIKKKPVLTNNE
jgi:hypothetical protein